jgi:chromosomal replication initiation ATPase DnaA
LRFALAPEHSGEGRLHVVAGEAGSGKTHLLRWTREEARAREYAVASVTLDGHALTWTRPRAIYRALVGSLEWPPG